MLIIEKGSKLQTVYREILSFEKRNPNKPITKYVDANNFWDCYNAVDYILRKFTNDELIMNISSGTKLLSMASILCSFNHGVLAHHYEQNRLVKLPVFKDITLKERLNDRQINTLKTIKNGMKWDELKLILEDRHKFPYSSIKDFNVLKKLGLVNLEQKDGDFKVNLTETGACFKEFFEN